MLENNNPKGIPIGRDPSADIRATGVRAYNVPEIGDIIEFAINCWNIHALPATLLSYNVFLDTDLDGTADYDVFSARLTDGRVATVILNLKTNEMVISSLFDGDFNSNNVILTVVASDVGLSPSNLKFNFYLETFDSFGIDPVDVSPVDLLTVGKPFTYDGNSRRFRTDSLAYEVDHSATIRVYADSNGFQASPSDKGLLLLYRNNAPEAEAESINVKVTSAAILAERLDFKPFGPSVESANIMDWDAAAPSVLRLLHIRP